MNKIITKIKSINYENDILGYRYAIFLILYSIYFLIQLPYLTISPTILIDEGWYANPSFNFISGRGLNDTIAYRETSVGHELFVYPVLLGVFYKLFGVSLFTTRLFSILSGFVALVGFIKILKELKISKVHIIFAGSLFIFSNVFYIVFRTGRPGALVVCLAIWSLLYLIKTYNSNSLISAFLCGITATASALCHPHGALYMALFFLVISYESVNRKNYKLILYYLFGCIPLIMIFIINLIAIRYDYIWQFIGYVIGRTSLESGDSIFVNLYSNIFDFVKSYSLGYKRILILLFEIGILIFGLSYFKRQKIIFILSSMGISFFLISFLFFSPFVSRHFGEIIIFSIILYALLIEYHKSQKKMYTYLVFLGILILGNNVAGDLYILVRDYQKTSYSYLEKKIDNIVPDNTNVLAPIEFWFPLKENYIFNSHTRYRNMSYKSLKNFISSNDADYIIYTDYKLDEVTPTSGRKEPLPSYKADYYEQVKKYSQSNGEIIEVIKTDGYSDIEIWKVKKD